MPYTTRSGDFETSPRDNHVDIIQNEAVQDKLEEYERTAPAPDEIDVSGVQAPFSESDSDRTISTFVGIDGSYNEVPVDDDHPADKIGFLQTAAVKVDAEALREDSEGRFVDPAAVNEMTTSDKLVAVLPGANIVGPSQDSVRATWRKEIYELFATHRVQDLTFLEAFQILLRYSPKASGDQVRVKGCPNPDCDGPALTVGFQDPAPCPACGTTVYPTDTLRIHETITEHGSNESALRKLMLTLEHLTAAAYTICLYYGDAERLAETMLFVDGQLAMFDVTAWLHDPLMKLYGDVREQLAEDGLPTPLVAGIEKSGTFVDHAEVVASKLDPGDVLTMSDRYLADYVLSSGLSSRGHGHNTYYGHRFIVKTFEGRVHVVTLPKRVDGESVTTDPADYPDLPAVIVQLGGAKTRIHENALVPIMEAHEEASIPGRTGSRVLRVFAEEELDSTAAGAADTLKTAEARDE